MNKLLSIVFIGALSFTLNGCNDSSNNVSCSGKTEKGMVEELILPTAKEDLLVNIIKETDPNKKKGELMNAGLMYSMIKNMSEKAGMEPDYSKIVNYESSLAAVKKEFSNYTLNLTDIRTTSKDKELNKVECVGSAHVQLENYTLDYAVTYSAQLGDDKKKIYVEISDLK